jgi:hypothetical protein
VNPETIADIEIRATIKEDKVIYDADTATQTRRGSPITLDPGAAHEFLAVLYEGMERQSSARTEAETNSR